MTITAINITLEDHHLESRYEAFNGDASEFCSSLSEYLEGVYPESVVEVEIDACNGCAMWVNEDDAHPSIPDMWKHVDTWLETHNTPERIFPYITYRKKDKVFCVHLDDDGQVHSVYETHSCNEATKALITGVWQ